MEEALQPSLVSRRSFRSLTLAALKLVALISMCSGCLTTGAGAPSMSMPKVALPKWDMLPHGEVSQVMALWADGVVVQTDPTRNGSPTPGFSSRVYLFGPELGQPLVADGSLIVYLYDDLQPKTDPQLPREVWVIDRASLTKVLKQDALGWGYNLWLPWSNYHPEIRKVSLVVCYRPEKGMDAWSGQHLLAVRQPEGPSGPRAMTPTAIKKPSSLQAKTEQTTGRDDLSLTFPR